MDKLWAPWRIGYIQNKKKKACIFCDSLKSRQNNFLILKNNYSFAILNKYPYNNGHLLIAPIRHIGDIAGLTEEEVLDLFKTINEAKAILTKVMKPQGFNLGINIGEISGAGIPGHLHVHIVPRWKGDTNFMPVISGVKVISQSLEDLFKRIKKAVALKRK